MDTFLSFLSLPSPVFLPPLFFPPSPPRRGRAAEERPLNKETMEGLLSSSSSSRAFSPPPLLRQQTRRAAASTPPSPGSSSPSGRRAPRDCSTPPLPRACGRGRGRQGWHSRRRPLPGLRRERRAARGRRKREFLLALPLCLRHCRLLLLRLSHRGRRGRACV